jgi:hypothetical protein
LKKIIGDPQVLLRFYDVWFSLFIDKMLYDISKFVPDVGNMTKKTEGHRADGLNRMTLSEPGLFSILKSFTDASFTKTETSCPFSAIIAR